MLASGRDSKALIASSTGIALSIGSPFSSTSEMSSDGATAQGRASCWKTAYGAARMAVGIAKESSDMFLPLKAVIGALSVLIENYDVSTYCSRAGRFLIFCLFHTPANIG